MDIELILDSAEIMALALRDTVRGILTVTAGQMDVSLEVTEVLARRAEGWPEVHITAAANELLTQLLATEENMFDEESTLMTLTRIDAQAILNRIEIEEAGQDALITRLQRLEAGSLPLQG